MNLVAKLLNTLNHLTDFILRGVAFHRDNHVISLAHRTHVPQVLLPHKLNKAKAYQPPLAYGVHVRATPPRPPQARPGSKAFCVAGLELRHGLRSDRKLATRAAHLDLRADEVALGVDAQGGPVLASDRMAAADYDAADVDRGRRGP